MHGTEPSAPPDRLRPEQPRRPGGTYDLLWRERSLRSVANFTRADAGEFLGLASAIPIRTAIQTFRLEDGHDALRLLATGELDGTPVLTTATPER